MLLSDGLEIKAAIEIEWVVSAGEGEDFVSAAPGAAYGMSRLIDVSDYVRDVVDALSAQGITVDQFHPEYAAGQLELSVAAESPVDAADTAVLVRSTIRAVGRRHNYRTSFSPKVEAEGVGNGGHVHLSVWRDGQNLMTGGDGRFGLAPIGEAFAAGILTHLPALLAIGAPSMASYLRLIPSHWAGVYACWGLENREAALRMITGSTGSSEWAANLEVKCLDLTANPYLLLAGLLAAGFDGIAHDGRAAGAARRGPGSADAGRAGRSVAFGGCQRACGSPLTHWPVIRYCAMDWGQRWSIRSSPSVTPRSNASPMQRLRRWFGRSGGRTEGVGRTHAGCPGTHHSGRNCRHARSRTDGS